MRWARCRINQLALRLLEATEVSVKLLRWMVLSSLMMWMGAATAIPQSALQVEQTLSKNSMAVRSCQGKPDQTTVTVRLQSGETVKPVDVVLALDASSSEDLPKIQDAARRLLAHLNANNGDQVALVSFADTARLAQGLSNDFDAVTSAIDGMHAGQLTALGDALNLALDTLDQNKRADALPAVVVFSDGGKTTGVDPLAQADRAMQLGLPVYFVGVSGGVNRAALSELAQRAGGNFFASASDQSLLGVLKRLERTLLAEFVTVSQTLPDALSYAGTPEGYAAPTVSVNLNGTTDLVWSLDALVSGQLWETQFNVVANQIGTFALQRAAQLSYLDAQGARVNEALPNPQIQVTGTPPPLVAFDLFPEQPKANQVIQFTDRSSTQGGTMTAWQWDFGDGASSSEQNPTHVYQDIGRYTVSLTVTDSNGCTVSHERTFRISEVVPGPVPDVPEFIPPSDGTTQTSGGTENAPSIAITIGTDMVRTGVEAAFSVDTEGTVQSCNWDFGDGASSDQCEATHQYMKAGTFTVKLTVTFDNGAQTTATRQVTVARENIKPTADFSVSPPNQRVRRPVGFDSSASKDEDGSIAAWQWDFGDGTTSTQANPIHEYERPGRFRVTLTVTDNEGAASAPVAKDIIVGLRPGALGDVAGLNQGPQVPEWMTFYIDGGVVTDEELEDAARRFANGSYVQSTQYRLTEDDLRAITDLHDLRILTAKYKDPAAAEADGYVKVGNFAPQRGLNYINETILNSDEPPQFDQVPVLVYAPDEEGQMKLAGVRFVAFEEDDAVLFGLRGWSTLPVPPPPGAAPPPPGAPRGVPDKVYVLTVWIWVENPQGMFVPANPVIQ